MRQFSIVRIILAFMVAVTAAAMTASVIQTQFNLAALTALAVEIDMDTRIATMFHDVLHFSPTMAVLLSISLVLALPVAYWLGRGQPKHERRWFVAAGLIGLMVAFSVIDYLAPVPTLIAANRTALGFIMLSSCGGLAGWIFHRLWHPTALELQEHA
jgi:ABC-type spermidine/putrescine transport system permease subunit I